MVSFLRNSDMHGNFCWLFHHFGSHSEIGCVLYSIQNCIKNGASFGFGKCPSALCWSMQFPCVGTCTYCTYIYLYHFSFCLQNSSLLSGRNCCGRLIRPLQVSSAHLLAELGYRNWIVVFGLVIYNLPNEVARFHSCGCQMIYKTT